MEKCAIISLVKQFEYKRKDMKKTRDNIIHLRPVVPLGEGQVYHVSDNRKKYKKVIIMIIVILLLLLVGCVAYINLTTFTNITVVTNYEGVSVANSTCVDFQSGFIKYGKDGATYINYQGNSIWNQAYEMSNPVIKITGECAVIADSGGNQVVVVDASGVKGEFETYLPIEKVAVSEQGIVAVLMNDGSSPQVICYDAAGNILVEHKSTLAGKGYPTGMALSTDGTVLLVTYLQISETGITSNYVYYSFNNIDQVTEDVIMSGSKEETVIPEAEFLNAEISVMINENSMEIFKGTESIELLCEVIFDKEVESVFYGEKQIGIIFKNSIGDTKELKVYNTSGSEIVSLEIIGEYESVDIVNNQIILYEKGNCVIYSLLGVEKFSGEMGTELLGVFPVFGVNKYVIIGNEGMQEVRLTR